MKNLKFTFFFILLAAFFVNAPMSYAVKTVTTPVTETAVKTKKEGKFFKNVKKKRASLKQRFSKWKHNLVGKILKKGIDLDDPVKKWLWYALLSWGASVVLYIITIVIAAGAVASATTTGVTAGFGIIGVLSVIGGLLWLFGVVSFVIWLIKKFG